MDSGRDRHGGCVDSAGAGGETSAEPPGAFRWRSARRAEIVSAGLDELFARLDVARHPEVTADDGIVADGDAAKYGPIYPAGFSSQQAIGFRSNISKKRFRRHP